MTSPHSLEDAYEKVTAWINEYNYFRPHRSLNDQTLAEAVEQYQNKESKRSTANGLPAASLHEAMYFAAAEHNPTTSENTYLHEEILNHQISPSSPT